MKFDVVSLMNYYELITLVPWFPLGSMDVFVTQFLQTQFQLQKIKLIIFGTSQHFNMICDKWQLLMLVWYHHFGLQCKKPMHVLGCIIFIYKIFHEVFRLALDANIMLVSIATQMFVEIISVNSKLEKLHTYWSNIWRSWLQIYFKTCIYI